MVEGGQRWIPPSMTALQTSAGACVVCCACVCACVCAFMCVHEMVCMVLYKGGRAFVDAMSRFVVSVGLLLKMRRVGVGLLLKMCRVGVSLLLRCVGFPLFFF